MLTYDYEDIEAPGKTLPRAVLSAIVVVIAVYVVVALLLRSDPLALALLALLVGIALFGRSWRLRHVRTEGPSGPPRHEL